MRLMDQRQDTSLQGTKGVARDSSSHKLLYTGAHGSNTGLMTDDCCLHQFRQAEGGWITKCHGLSGLNKTFTFPQLQAEKSKLKVPADSLLGDRSLPACRQSLLSVCSDTLPRGRERESSRSGVSSSYEGTDSTMGLYYHDPIITKLLPKSSTSNPITVEIRTSTHEF